jgi:rod shape-determining protein MreC
MDSFLSRYRNLSALLLVVSAQLMLLAYQVKNQDDVRLLRIWSVTAVTPVARVLETVRGATWGRLREFVTLRDLRAENQRLKTEVDELTLRTRFLENELRAADRAKALAAFQERSPSRMLAARVIGSGTGPGAKTVFIDRGSGAGVMRNMAVITARGIVGKVVAAYPTASLVLLVNDPGFAAGVVSQRSGIHGTWKGTGETNCRVVYIQNEEKVEIGELFFTSGEDRIFPRGFPAGRVIAAREGHPFKEIVVAPLGLQGGVEEVLVILEGVHQPVPTGAEASSEFKLLPPPPDAPPASSENPTTQGAFPDEIPGLVTEADRLRLRYKALGESQRHRYGDRGTGAPDFNQPLARPSAPASPSGPSGSNPGADAPATGQEGGTPPAAGGQSPGAGTGAGGTAGARTGAARAPGFDPASPITPVRAVATPVAPASPVPSGSNSSAAPSSNASASTSPPRQ